MVPDATVTDFGALPRASMVCQMQNMIGYLALRRVPSARDRGFSA
jgi:hypothetical protein